MEAEIENNSTLRALDLSKNKIGVSGTQAIAEVLRKNSSLCYLTLNNNNSDVDGARSLKRLELASCNLNKNDADLIGLCLANQGYSHLSQYLSQQPPQRRSERLGS